jgi:hypothetical protein
MEKYRWAIKYGSSRNVSLTWKKRYPKKDTSIILAEEPALFG